MIKKRAVLLMMGIFLVVCQYGVAFSADSAPASLQEIDQQVLSLLKEKKYVELDVELKAYVSSYEADFRNEKYMNTAFIAFARPIPEFESLLTEWISRQPNSYAAYLARGIYYTDVGWKKRGGKLARETTREQFDTMELYFDKAMKDLDKALSINKRLINALCYEMLILSHFSEKDEMHRLRDTALAMNPYSSTVRFTYISTVRPRWGGSIHAMAKEIEAARPYFEKNPVLKPIQGRILVENGDQARFAKEYTKAIGLYTEALQYGSNAFHNLQRGYAYSFSKQFDLCIKDMDIAIALAPNNACAYSERGYAKHRLQRYNEAVIDLSKSIEDDPYDASAWITRGYAYSFLGKKELALGDYEKAVALSPNNQQYKYARDQAKKEVESKNSALQK